MAKKFLPSLVAGALVLAACGSDKTVDTATIEQGIKQQVDTASPITKVSCPDDVKAEKGDTFNCSLTAENGATGKVKVTQQGANQFVYTLVPGSVQVPGSVVEKSVAQELEQKGSADATVNCPDNIIVKVGTYVVCDVTSAKGVKGTVKFTFSDSSGTVDTSSVEST